MIALWLAVGVLMLVSVLSVLVPVALWRRRNELNADDSNTAEDKNDDRERQNLAIFEENIAELDQRLSDGVINQQDYDQLKLETERNLLVDIPEQSSTPDHIASIPSPRSAWMMAVVLSVVIPVASVYLYSQWGAADRVSEGLKLESSKLAGETRSPAGKSDFSQLADQLEAKLQDRPDDITGWLLLAKTRMSLGEHQKAAEIYSALIDKADTDKNRAMVTGLYAQAVFFTAGQRVTAEVLQAVELALQADPHEVTALGLKGVDAFAKQNYSEAIANWKLAAANTSNEENRQTLLRGVEQAKQRMGSNAVIQDFGTLLVDLSIKPALLEGLDPNLRVYLFAKAVDGPRQPLAVSRYKLSDLPLSAVLDDSMAINPNLKISGFEQVEVVARVSKSGEPTASRDDLQGSTTLSRRGSRQTGVRLVIDSVIQ